MYFSLIFVTLEGDAVGAVGVPVGAEVGAREGLEGAIVGSTVGWWS